MPPKSMSYAVTVICLFLSLSLASCDFDLPDNEDAEGGPQAIFFDLDGEMPSFKHTEGLFPSLAQSQYRFEKLLDKAVKDAQVQEIMIHIGAPEVSLGRMYDLRLALEKVQKSQKPIACHIDGAGNLTYMLAAAACPKIYVSPAGGVEALGLGIQAIYIKELLSSIGVKADMLHVGKYKDAAEMFTRSSMSPASRESAKALLDELSGQFVDAIAKGRGLEATKVKELINGGPYGAEKSVELGLVDEVTPLSTWFKDMHAKYEGGVNRDYGKPPTKAPGLGDFLQLLSGAEQDEDDEDKIALIPVIGSIMSRGDPNLSGSSQEVVDSELVAALSDAAQDEHVLAVVLRIDSPGGSVIASDNIWNAVRALAEVKPVIASMGDIAASGGYYIASAATEILASPGTLTGSIGVVGGKMVVQEAAQKWGLNTESITTSKRALLHSAFTEFNPDEKLVVRQLMQRSYDLFIQRIVTGRKLKETEVRAVAEGRVWTGSQALEHKLIDNIGGLVAAIERARTVSGAAASVPVKFFPRPKNMMDKLSEAFGRPEEAAVIALGNRYKSFGSVLALTEALARERVLAHSPILFEIY